METVKNKAVPGTVICGTLQVNDLIIGLSQEIEYLTGQNPVSVPEDAVEDGSHPYWDSKEARADLEELLDALDELAPEGHYFGAHPGDASDFGFWQYEEDFVE